MTGNNGNNGNNGNAGNRGAAGIVGEFGGGWFIEDRFDIPFVTLPLPPEVDRRSTADAKDFDEFKARIGGQIRNSPATFADNQWTARWAAWRVLDPFASSAWLKAADETMEPRWAKIDKDVTTRELRGLARAARDERAAALGQILSEDVEFITDFMSLLSMTPSSHPHTYGLLHIGSQVGSYAALHYKAKTDWKGGLPAPRPRPSQLLPALMPPVPLPGHPAWPSGHATQARLMAQCVLHALQKAGSGTGMDAADLDVDVTRAALLALATRIARNREIAGLHYPTDSEAGRELADTVLQELKKICAFNEAVKAVVAEWTKK